MSQTDQSLAELLTKYLSKENLQIDPELSSCITDDFSLSVEFISIKFNVSIDDIIKLLCNSDICKLTDNNTMIKLIFPRKTVIFRDVSETIVENDIKELFKDTIYNDIIDVKKDANAIWYVTFTSEEYALQAIQIIRENNLLLDNQEIKCRLKNEEPLLQPLQRINNDYYSYYYNYYDMNQFNMSNNQHMGNINANYTNNNINNNNNEYNGHKYNNSHRGRNYDKWGGRYNHGNRGRGGAGNINNDSSDRNNRSFKKIKKDRQEYNQKPINAKPLVKPNFPPLVSTSAQNITYIYNDDDIVNIVKNIADSSLPIRYDPSSCLAVSETPDGGMLRNQRSLSVDSALKHLTPFTPIPPNQEDQIEIISSFPNDDSSNSNKNQTYANIIKSTKPNKQHVDNGHINNNNNNIMRNLYSNTSNSSANITNMNNNKNDLPLSNNTPQNTKNNNNTHEHANNVNKNLTDNKNTIKCTNNNAQNQNTSHNNLINHHNNPHNRNNNHNHNNNTHNNSHFQNNNTSTHNNPNSQNHQNAHNSTDNNLNKSQPNSKKDEIQNSSTVHHHIPPAPTTQNNVPESHIESHVQPTNQPFINTGHIPSSNSMSTNCQPETKLSYAEILKINK